MLIDVNAYLGHWAFRQLRQNTARELVRLMDRKEIDLAVVSSASAIMYKNSQAGNEELARDIRRYRDRLIPFAVINPTYADWEHDLGVCAEDFGVRFYGIPSGYEFASLLQAIRTVASGQPQLAEETLEFLRQLEEPVHIQVFVTPTCPYCPGSVILGHYMAVASPMIQADMVEATEFPHLSMKYEVMGVPRLTNLKRCCPHSPVSVPISSEARFMRSCATSWPSLILSRATSGVPNCT